MPGPHLSMPGLCYGGDYNPDQWPEEVWHEDAELMRRAGVNLVSLGVFSWSQLEPAPGRYEFGWLDRVMDILHAAGVRVALATPTASPPPWFSLEHPDALPVRQDGVRLTHGSRDAYCVAAPAYREASRRIAEKLGERYAGHPALALWHVHNEYGTWCHCDHAAQAFRRWLRHRHGTLDRLNEAWTAAFWSQWYDDWDAIMPPRTTQYLSNPAHVLDFRRFLSAEMLASFVEQRDVLRAFTPQTPVTTNFVFGSWVPVDNARWAAEVDLVAIDDYPAAADSGAEEQTAVHADLARGWAGGEPWLLIEHAPNLLTSDGRKFTKEPGRMARLSLSHIARGSRGAMFFQWRASRGGSEVFHSAMVPHAGPDSRIFRETEELGAVLRRLSAVDDGSRVEARVAVLWDAEAWWGLEATSTPSPDLRYLEQVYAVHRTLWRAGVTTDVVHPSADLTGYALVLVPSLYLISDRDAASMEAFVSGGGSLAVWYFSGIATPEPWVRLGGYPGAFRSVLGIRVEEFLPLAAGETVPLSTGAAGRFWSERVHLTGAEPVDHYAAGVLDGLPAVTRHRYGTGTAWYVSTSLDDAGLARLLGEVTGAAGVGPVRAGLPAGVEVVRRVGAEHAWLFVINHTTEAVDVAADGIDLISGERVDGALALPAGGYAVIRETGQLGRV